MKTFIKVFLLVVAMGAYSCFPPFFVDPKHSKVFYTFITSEGDLFETKSNYLIENLYGETDEGVRVNFENVGIFNEVNYFQIHSWPVSPIFIDYGNGDIDTLTVQYGPPGIDPITKFSKIDFVQWKLNGVLITDWDFKKNPGLRDSVGYYPSHTRLPVPVIIPK